MTIDELIKECNDSMKEYRQKKAAEEYGTIAAEVNDQIFNMYLIAAAKYEDMDEDEKLKFAKFMLFGAMMLMNEFMKWVTKNTKTIEKPDEMPMRRIMSSFEMLNKINEIMFKDETQG
ncbi:MAG: hypothetical protein ISN29_02040 [Gammaproteobacteria bacterium AqS3]|nr:hypothetical protein [Gammaproteobacteria bacterium AqS3]